uniref:YTH domain-containing family protein n=1 Tax=Davidia involucrata TaxID=16924 RepID=A0A5B7B6Q9_DAVIN
MQMYDVSEHRIADAYMIQGTESNPHLTGLPLEQFEAMYNEGAPEFVVEPGIYYPNATNYGYVCTGFESPGDWDDHHRIFGLDGQEIQYAGAQTESLPYVYYTPSYGYAQSPYNPYNPYIPGAMVGVDGPFVGTQQYYTIPSYENSVSSPTYFPMLVQSRPDIISNSTTDSFLDTGAYTANRADGPGLKHNMSSASATFTLTPPRPASNQTHSFTRVSEGPKANAGPSKLPAMHGSGTSGSFSSMASSQVLQGRGAQAVDNITHGKALSHRNQLKVTLPSSNGLSNFGSNAHGRATMDKVRPKFHYGKVPNDSNISPDALTEQNRGPRTNKSKHHLAVKAYTTRAGDSDAQGNIIIYTDQYNKDDFQVDYVNAKFFVIKSYSEDDVHKSIKYKVWSSTPNGNKKLESAYADAQRIVAAEPRGCPVFLFFSVNASGQFCGVAEMIGPVDFHKDMDFWQQDKWSGSFPVKWHIIKDVPNSNFRHIILENNENKPVTNSRDTQEIRYKQGTEMLKIFKNYTLKTTLLDDFMYYENRQKIMQEEKARLLIKSYESPFLVPALDPPRKLNCVVDLHSSEDDKITKHNDLNSSETTLASPAEQVQSDSDGSSLSTAKENAKRVVEEARDDIVSMLKIGSLTINPKQDESRPLETATATASAIAAAVVDAKPVDIVTVGSMPIKVNGLAESTGFLTFGTIPLDPRALQLDEAGKSGSQH